MFEPVNERLVGNLLRDGTHLHCKFEAVRHTEFNITEKGLYGGKADIARADAVPAVPFQCLQEGQKEGHREVLDLQIARTK